MSEMTIMIVVIAVILGVVARVGFVAFYQDRELRRACKTDLLIP